MTDVPQRWVEMAAEVLSDIDNGNHEIDYYLYDAEIAIAPVLADQTQWIEEERRVNAQLGGMWGGYHKGCADTLDRILAYLKKGEE